ncbi:MAG: sensor domain-containing diguanylate cyclase [Aphanothece saxicola GSE-SYN-MK-01-06B]|nr:sensor domain-containing diguanylate cyclase [Aphanothece saxicola GSE-SYN-MK-01-06B]
MKSPETPEDEKLRLAKLRSLQLLDTGEDAELDRLTRMAGRIFKAPISVISLVDDERLLYKSCVGLTVSEIDRSMSFCGHTIVASDVMIVEDTLKDERFFDNPMVVGDPHIRFYAGCPLIIDQRKIGTLCIADQEVRSLDPAQIETLKDLACLVQQQLAATSLATRDGLTGLENRRGFLALAQQSLQLCTRQGLPVSLLYLDLEHFKTINNLHGHGEGDRVLITFADQIKHVCRDSDVVARLGGDEFVVLLINSTREQSEAVIHRIKAALMHENRLSNKTYNIDFSYGITSYQPERHETIAELLADADALMHEIKLLRSEDQGAGRATASAATEASWSGFTHRFQETAG